MKANLKFYEDKEQTIIADLARYGRQSGILSFLRLISFLGAAGLIIGGYAAKLPVLYFAGGAVFILFVLLCIIHGGIIEKVNYLNELSKVNASYIARIKGDFNELRNIAVKGLKRAEDIGAAKNRLYVYGGQIGVKNSGRNGLQSKNGFDMFGGTINIEGVGNHTNKQSRGIIVSGDESEDGAGLGGMNFVDGVVNITTVGKAISAKWDIEDDAETTETTDDPSPVVKISGGTFNITTSGQVIDSDRSQNTVSYYDEDGILTTEAEKCSPEGIEGKLGLEISGGTFNINTTDDALNASRDGSAYINISGGSLYLNASSADAIDSNGDINISGGVIVSVATMGSEDGFDCDGKLTFTGGVAVGISGSNHEYASTGSSTTTQNTFVIGSSYLGSQNTVMAIMDSSDNPVFVFKLPSTSYSLATVSSPNLAAADTYGVYSGVTVSGGTEFRGLYTVMPSVSGGSLTGSVTTNDSTHVYTSLSQGGGGSFGPGAGGGEPPSFPGGR